MQLKCLFLKKGDDKASSTVQTDKEVFNQIHAENTHQGSSTTQTGGTTGPSSSCVSQYMHTLSESDKTKIKKRLVLLEYSKYNF